MSDEKIFQKNIELWGRFQPKDALMLNYGKDFEKALVPKSSDSESKEAKAWFKSLNLQNIQILYVYGVGQGYYYQAALKWLKEDPGHYLVFLEDDIHVIRKLFQTELATRLLHDRQVFLVYSSDLLSKDSPLENLHWNYVMKNATVSALDLYAKAKGDIYSGLCHKIPYENSLRNALIEEYLKYGGIYYLNFYQNLLYLPQSYLGNNFFGKFPKVPAIICGAGPSFEKNIALLKELQEKALIFAGGSAVNVLNTAGIQPHFGAGIDPNPAQQVRLRTNTAYEAPYFYRNRMYHDAFLMIHGPKLYITGGGGYDTAMFFEEKFDLKEEFIDEGHNVVNFCAEIARRMGCDPIIFVGMDLSFTEKKLYAPGVVMDESVEKEAMLSAQSFDMDTFIKKDIYGNPVHTLWKWVAESEWIGEFAKNNSTITLVNCTEGGIGFPGVPNKPLADMAKKYLEESYDIRSRVHAEVQNSYLPKVTTTKLEHEMDELKASLLRCKNDFEVLIEELDKGILKVKNDKLKQPPGQSGRAALAETELADEAGYQYVIEIFNEVYARVLNRELQELTHLTVRSAEWRKVIQKMELNRRRLVFLKELASINADIIDYAFKERAKRQESRLKEGIEAEIIDCPLELKSIKSKKKKSQNIGMKEGPWRIYYDSGALKGESNYTDGKLNGLSSFYAQDGNVLAEGYFIDGKQTGDAKWYYPSGKLYSLQRFKKGLWHGHQEYYYSDGKPKTLIEYDHGKIIGTTRLFAPDGKLEREIVWK